MVDGSIETDKTPPKRASQSKPKCVQAAQSIVTLTSAGFGVPLPCITMRLTSRMLRTVYGMLPDVHLKSVCTFRTVVPGCCGFIEELERACDQRRDRAHSI